MFTYRSLWICLKILLYRLALASFFLFGVWECRHWHLSLSSDAPKQEVCVGQGMEKRCQNYLLSNWLLLQVRFLRKMTVRTTVQFISEHSWTQLHKRRKRAERIVRYTIWLNCQVFFELWECQVVFFFLIFFGSESVFGFRISDPRLTFFLSQSLLFYFTNKD